MVRFRFHDRAPQHDLADNNEVCQFTGHTKGLFLSIPLSTLLTRDTQAVAPMSIAPWTRDVGAMVVSPLDLYRLMEKPLVLDVHDHDGLVMFGDVDDNYHRSPGTTHNVRPAKP